MMKSILECVKAILEKRTTDYWIVEPAICFGREENKTYYNGVIQEKNGTIPQILVTVDKPIAEINDEEEEKIYDICSQKYPILKEIKKRQIQPRFGVRGVENGDAWEKTPRLGLFDAGY